MNSNIINIFEKLIAKTINDIKISPSTTMKFKLVSYKKTLDIIKKLTSCSIELTHTDQIKDIKGIGKTTIIKINEILETGTLEQLKDFDTGEVSTTKQLLDLQKITGIGPSNAKKFIEQNITLDTLLEIDFSKLSGSDIPIIDSLTHHQQLGVKYFHDLEHKIPHYEIVQIETYLKEILDNIVGLNMIICGSYRRKKKESGDIDILLYHDTIKDETTAKKSNYLALFLKLLISKKFITDHLTAIDKPTKYMGFCKFKDYNRRIDIRLIPNNSVGSAMLYFTGSGEFNKSMRTYALKNGFTINEYGIYKLKPNGEKGLKIRTKTENDIFKTLKLDYVEPEDRVPEYIF
jgi:DNA polymerase beta